VDYERSEMLLSRDVQAGVPGSDLRLLPLGCGFRPDGLRSAKPTRRLNVTLLNGRRYIKHGLDAHVHKWVRLSTHCVGLSTPGHRGETRGIPADFGCPRLV